MGEEIMRYRPVLFCLVLVVIVPITVLASDNNSGKQKITIGMIGKMGNNPVFIAAYSGARVAVKELSGKYKVDIVIDRRTFKNKPLRWNVFQVQVLKVLQSHVPTPII